MWKWPLPIKSSMSGNGFIFPKIPKMDLKDIVEEEEKNKVGDSIWEIEADESIEDLRKYSEDWKEEYKGKNLFFYPQVFKIEE